VPTAVDEVVQAEVMRTARDLFNRFDTDLSGKLSRNELAEVCPGSCPRKGDLVVPQKGLCPRKGCG
jgi:Ca2+-binding EF-hand superfamily protein